jgi:hypothetical protein
VATPDATPDTTPVDALIVAMPILFEDHVPPETVDVKELVAPIQMVWFPLRVPAVGSAVMVMTRVAVAFEQPPVPETV